LTSFGGGGVNGQMLLVNENRVDLPGITGGNGLYIKNDLSVNGLVRVGAVTSTGVAVYRNATTGILTTTSSDERVKQNITQITALINKMNIELINTEQLENKYTILQKIRTFEISYVVITRAFLTSVEAAETTIINMVKKTITIAVMIAAMDKTNKNAEIAVSKLTELMETWEKKTNEAEIAKNTVMIFITSIQTPTSLLNLPEIITSYTTEINKRSICNTFIDIVKQWISEYP
jgi:hypothetical protein